MFGSKKNRAAFTLDINKAQAEEEYREYLSQPQEVLEKLKKCKMYMAIYIPVGIIITLALLILCFDFKSLIGSIVTLGICMFAGSVNFFASKKFLSNWKLRLVPLICLCVGWIIGIFCVQRILLIIMNIAG